LGILRRYVLGEVTRAFGLALLTMTAIFVLFMVAAQARDIGLSPGDIAHLVPYVVPSTLPYTIPVSLLFAVTVVYGRLAGDNEIIAVKTAGLSVGTVLWPTIYLATGLSVLLFYMSNGWIPACTHEAKMVLFKDLEDTFYKLLKRDREFNHPAWPFLIKVREVRDNSGEFPSKDGIVFQKFMIDATFKHKAKRRLGDNDYDAVIQAHRAVLKFDLPARAVRVYFENAEVQRYSHDADVMLINNQILEIPIPPDSKFGMDKKVQEFTDKEIVKEIARYHRLLSTERLRHALASAFSFATGRLEQVKWGEVNQAFLQQTELVRKCNEFETERQLRLSMACGSLLFVILGAPVGIRFARRDFLSAFITCFVPIIIMYYPLMLFGTNLSKEGMISPVLALWMGNVLLAVLAGLVLPPVIKH
jgi:lipopolysaccharide export system permease protein